MKNKLIMAVGMSALSMVVQTKATFIDGEISFSSLINHEVTLAGGSTFQTATGLNFTAGPNAGADGADGDFSTELGGTATFYSFSFAAGAKPVWKLTSGHFSFDLNPGAV